MPDYSAGTASVRIRPNADHFIRELRAKLNAAKDPGYVVNVSADTGQATNDIRRFREVEQRKGMRVGVDVALGQAQADMVAFRARQQADGLTVKVDADVDRARRQLTSLRTEMGAMSALRLNLGAGAIAGIQPAVTGLAQLAAGLQQVAQAGIALPGAIAAAGASIGTLVLGLSGIKEAWDAASQASEESGRNQADQARAAAAASNNLRNSLVDEAEARKDVVRATKDARQALQDLRIEQRGGMIDESRAILEAQKAREDLARGNYSDVRDAMLRVAEADQRVLEVRNRNAQTADKVREANEKGIANSDQVVAANERLVRSQQQVADAQAQAADAAGKTGAAQQKYEQLMKNLAPAQREVVQTLLDLKPAFQSVRDAAAEPLLAGKAKEFRDFFTSIQPNLEAGVGGIARGLNQNISALFGSLGSEEGKGLIDRILGNTGEAQALLSNTIDPLVKGIGTLTAAGTDALPRMANGLTAVSERFRNFITQADQDGRLEKWINDGLDGLTNLGNSVLNIGKSFTAITGASGGGRSFTQWLADATGRLQTFLNSAEGQNQLRDYFAQGREMIAAVVPLLKELPGAFQAIAEGASSYIGTGVLPILTQLAKLMGDHPQLVQAAVAAYLGFKTIQPITQMMTGSFAAISNGLTGLGTGFAGTRDKAKAAMGDVDKSFKDAGKEGSGLKNFAKSTAMLGAVGGPLGILAATAIPALIGALGELDKKNRESAQVTKDLQTAQESLETTVDRVTGKLTAQSREALIKQAQGYDATDRPGGGIPGVSQGDALAAAVKLGIPADVYADALEGKPGAKQRVVDILTKNNLVPEFQANPALGNLTKDLSRETGGQLGQQDLINALLGDPAAVKRYTDIVTQARQKAQAAGGPTGIYDTFDLSKIAQSLSETGRASVLSGGALNFFNQALPGVGGPTQQANQAQYGEFRVKGGVPSPFAPGTLAQSSGSDYQIVVPGSMADQLRGAGIEFSTNSDGTLTAKVPLDAPYIERKYKQGSRGRTPGGRNQGFLAELHGQEWVHDAGTVDRYGPEVMNAMWRGQLDPDAVRGLLPKFKGGGPTDPDDPNYVGIATGQAPGGMLPGPTAPPPVAPNPLGGGLNNVVGHFMQGMQGPINNATNLFGMLGQQQGGGQQAGGTGIIPGLWGLGQIAGMDPSVQPLAQQAWQQQTVNWLMNDWLGGTVVSGLMSSVLPPVLDAVGLGGILNSPYLQAFKQGVDHFSGLMNPGNQTLPSASSNTGLGYDQLSAMYGLGPLAGLGALANSGAGADVAAQYMAQLKPGQTVSMASVKDWPRLYAPGVDGKAPIVPADLQAFVKSIGSGSLVANTRDTGDTLHQAGFAFDISGSPEDMKALAEAVRDNYSGQTLQLIYEGIRGNGELSAGARVGPEYYAESGNHADHVHWAIAPGLFGNGAVPGGFAPTAGATGYEDFLKQIYQQGGAYPGMPAGITGLKARAYQAYVQAGLPPSEWNAFDQLLTRESGWDPAAVNPSSGAFGLHQFLGHENDIYGQLGGYSSDPMAQLRAGFRYLQDRYGGSPAAALSFHDANNWYYNGGHTPGAPHQAIPAILHGDEFVHRSAAVQKYGVQFMQAINEGRIDPAQLPHFALGGSVRDVLAAARAVPQPTPPKPRFDPGPPIKSIEPRPAPRPAQPRPAAPTPQAPAPTPAPAPQPVPMAPPPQEQTTPAPRQAMPVLAPPPVAGPSGVDYTLPWVNQAIQSGASTLGNIAATAISMGAGAAGGVGGGMGGALAASMVQGLFQQGGKIVQGVANVISGAMIGSVPGSFMSTPEAYGRTQMSPPRELATAAARGGAPTINNWSVTGYSPRDVAQEIAVQESINQQSQLANHPDRI